jgi:hypothetical protein
MRNPTRQWRPSQPVRPFQDERQVARRVSRIGRADEWLGRPRTDTASRHPGIDGIPSNAAHHHRGDTWKPADSCRHGRSFARQVWPEPKGVER